MNQLPPLALQPLALPAPNPNAPQPNWNDMANALAAIGNEIPNLPQPDPMQQILAMNNNIMAIVAEFNRLQTIVVDGLNSVNAKLNLVPMRIHNGSASPSAPVRYPPGIVAVVGGALPMTKSDALSMTDPQCMAAIDALGPDLEPIPDNTPVNQKRHHFLEFVGIL